MPHDRNGKPHDRIGKYRILDKIGSGAMGDVYRALDPLLEREVALKTVSPHLAADETFQRRFQREARSAAQLNHPNIVTIYDFGESDGVTYMAMELLEGRELRDTIRAGDLLLGERLSILEQICEGLAFAHSKGVVHRDLKPGNVHVQPNGRVKILDFGLARLRGADITKTGTVMGTPNYMAPEQVRGQKADERSDVFSLGAVAYELLSRRRPFEADSLHGVLFQILENDPEPIRKAAPEVPALVAEIVARALAKDPALRFADAGEMAQALAVAREALGGQTMSGSLRVDRVLGTMLRSAEATALHEPGSGPVRPMGEGGRSRPSIEGATVRRLDSRDSRSGVSRTFRPGSTVARAAALWRLPARRAALLVAGGIVLAAAIAGVAVNWRGAEQAPPGPAAGQEIGILTEALVTSHVELARSDLANHDYRSAARRAGEALKLNPASRDAAAVRAEAERGQRQLEAAVDEARRAAAGRDLDAAARALSRVLSLDPAHPVVADLSGELNTRFRQRAQEAARQSREARSSAQRARASAFAGFAQGGALATEAERLARRQEYALAAQKFMASREAFERSERDARARAASREAPTQVASDDPPARAAASPGPNGQPEAVTPTAPPPSRAADATPTPAPMQTAPTQTAPAPAPAYVPPAPATLPPPAAGRPGSPPASAPRAAAEDAEAAVRRVIADYGRAIGTQDIELFRRLKPGLSQDEERSLRRAFDAIRSQRVGITIGSVEVDGERATVRVRRQDVVNGRSMEPVSQTFQLARVGGRWEIQSIGQ